MDLDLKTSLRLLGALAVLAGGVLHVKIWNSTYKDIPSGAVAGVWVVKVGFLVQAVVSVVVAGVVVFVRRPIAWLLGILVDLGSVIALILSRQASLFGWKEPDWSSDAKQVLAVECAAVVLLALVMAIDLAKRNAEEDRALL